MVNNENGDVLTFNGEIYDAETLRVRLAEGGYPFRTRSDTELLLAEAPSRGIATSGRACKGRGGKSFSFGIADAVTVLARTAAARASERRRTPARGSPHRLDVVKPPWTSGRSAFFGVK